jgi:hypothetical protein
METDAKSNADGKMHCGPQAVMWQLRKTRIPKRKKKTYLESELLAELKCNQQQRSPDTDTKTDANFKSLRRRWCKRGLQQLLK